MKKSVIAFAILTTVTIVLLVLNMSKSQTIDNLTKEKATLEQKVADIQTEVDSIKSQLDEANAAQKKQKEELKTMANVIAHNEQLRDENNALKQKLAKLQTSKPSSAPTAKSKTPVAPIKTKK
ncbi:MAG: hypothetical protein ACKN9H_04395 [Methylophilaceae bacterium]